MNSQDFLTLNLVGAGAFIFWYLVSRGGPRRPTQLNLKAKDSAPPIFNPLPPESEGNVPSIPTESPAAIAARSYQSTRRSSAAAAPVRAKNLNVMFIYNGHSWDAYEVLGVPAGASISLVTEAYQTAVRRADKESVDFLETAFRAILNKSS